MRKRLLYLSVAIFLGALGLSWLTHGTGVVTNDLARNIYVPKDLTMPLQVKAAYNGRDMFFRYRWPARQPSIYHDMLKFEGGKWVRYGDSEAGRQAQGIYEDRITMFVDDGSVPEFARYGGYVAVGDRMRFFTDEAKPKEVRAHPYLGQKLKQTEVRKYLPATRRDINDWASVVPEEELAALRKAGYFLDLWHWRAHRSNPIDVSDDEYVFEVRSGDAGRGPFTDNWDPEKNQPRFMLDPEKTGRRALRWEDLIQRKLGLRRCLFHQRRHRQAVRRQPSMAGGRYDSAAAAAAGRWLARRHQSRGQGSLAGWLLGCRRLSAPWTPAIRWTTRSWWTGTSTISPSPSIATRPAVAGTTSPCR